MITYTTGNLLEAETEALVNTVNTVGVMGKGVALMFKERFADNYRQYKKLREPLRFYPGYREMFIFTG